MKQRRNHSPNSQNRNTRKNKINQLPKIIHMMNLIPNIEKKNHNTKKKLFTMLKKILQNNRIKEELQVILKKISSLESGMRKKKTEEEKLKIEPIFRIEREIIADSFMVFIQ